MKYPFTPELLDALPEELAELFRGLELTLLEEICSRLKIRDNLNEVTIQDIRALRSHGIDIEDIKKAISQNTNTSMDKLNKLFDDVVERNQKYYTDVIDIAKVTMPDRLVNQRDIEAIKKQTQDEFHNITQSMGFLVNAGRTMLPPARAYQWALDSAELQVQSGAINYTQAIETAVKQLADRGLCVVKDDDGNYIKNVVEYEAKIPGGKRHIDSLDVAVRRAVMTGVNQINQQYREQSMDYLETDLVEVTAHRGARDIGDTPENHKLWQGFVYRWAEKPKTSYGEYPDFEEVCGYGLGEGIGGWNCRHSFHPFVEGVSERTYTDEELANIDLPPFEYEGRTYTAYEATQKQRSIERSIRKQKRLKTAYEAAGLKEDATAANIKLRRLNQKYKEFSKAAGLPEQRDRVKVQYPDDKSAQNAAKLKIKRDAEAPIREAIKRGDYDLTINPEKQARHMKGTAKQGKSVITIPIEELQEIVKAQAGSGKIELTKSLEWKKQEIIYAGKEIGYTINKKGDIIIAKSLKIHYSGTGIHAVPCSRWWKK